MPILVQKNKNGIFFIFLLLILSFFSFSIFAEDWNTTYQEVQALKNQKKYSVAIPLLEKMVKADPANLDWKMDLCTFYRWNQSYAEASQCYDEVLAKKQNHTDALMGKAYLANRENDAKFTRYWIGKVFAIDPLNLEALLLLAGLEKKEKNYEKSQTIYQQVLARDPQNEEAQNGLKNAPIIKDPITAVNRNHFDILDSTKKHWRIDVGGGAMKFNFAKTAPSALLQVYYTKPKKYFLLGRFDYLNKFGDRVYTVTAGGGYYVLPRLILSDLFSTAPTSNVSARIQNVFEMSGIAPHGLNPYMRYGYSQYQFTKVHSITNGLAWYFNSWGILDLNYANILTKTDINEGWARDYSTTARFTFIPIEDKFKLYVGYSREQESFDAGNPVFPIGRFRSNHYSGGIEWVMTHGVGLRVDTDYEDRNNGQIVQTYTSSIFYQFH